MTIADLLNYIKENKLEKLLYFDVNDLLLLLLKDKKIDFIELTKLYVSNLEYLKDYNKCNLIETASLLQLSLEGKPAFTDGLKHRACHMVRKHSNLNNDYLEEKFGYDNQKGEKEFNELYYPYKKK